MATQLFHAILFSILCAVTIAFTFYYMFIFGNRVLSAAEIFSKIDSGVNITNDRNDLRYHWLRMHRARTDWQTFLKPCSDQMAWGSLKSGWGKVNRSSANTSYISYMDIRPSGQFSRIFIQTRTANGQDKIIGGDYWRVLFTGPASVSATVFDYQNGTYEAMALLIEPGNYSIRAYLDYSLCDGVKDPPEYWFRLGNDDGKEQPKGTLGVVDHVIHKLLQAAVNLVFEVLPNQFSTPIEDLSTIQCSHSCRALWDGYGRWRNENWRPYLVSANGRQQSKNISTQQKLKPRSETLWILGDSLSHRLYGSLLKKPLCRKVFESCKDSYLWTYPLAKGPSKFKRWNDDHDFRPNIILEAIRNVLRDKTMKGPQSLFVLNLGIHYTLSINFTTYQRLIDDVIEILLDREVGLGSRAKVVWKTTTSTDTERHKEHQAKGRFYTGQRVRLFDTYAMSAMCKAGFEVLDVFPLTASYEPGTMDSTHFYPSVFNAAIVELENYVRMAEEYKSTEVCTT